MPVRAFAAMRLLCLVMASSAQAFSITGYLPEYRMGGADYPRLVQPGTTLVLFSLQPKHTGALDTTRIPSAHIKSATEARDTNGGKVFVSIGGAGRSDAFPAVARDAFLRKRFVRRLVQFCTSNRLDGADFDWEAPADASQMQHYSTLLVEVKRAFAADKLELSVAVHVWQVLPQAAVEAVDWVNLMAYDASHDQTKRHSTMETAQSYVQHVLGQHQGIKEKLVLGIPCYGRDRNRLDRVLTYEEIVREHSPEYNEDELADGMYFNGPETVAKKSRWAKEIGLAGVMFWELGQDSKDAESSLLQAARTVQGGQREL
eukprot:TRINITY_DN2258_c0_g1_i1.p1 TRINITY_DN2258_c0_g1~~TRINITY_DN2258_c0_g1_i1.p1  ORF type:complete len:316 (-),score=79.76 TRINITY_DN2258_c0_g1_i1:1294-2241(-)